MIGESEGGEDNYILYIFWLIYLAYLGLEGDVDIKIVSEFINKNKYNGRIYYPRSFPASLLL